MSEKVLPIKRSTIAVTGKVTSSNLLCLRYLVMTIRVVSAIKMKIISKIIVPRLIGHEAGFIVFWGQNVIFI